MPDREKVIKGIDSCLRFNCGKDCTYYDNCGIGCTEQLRKDVITLLKEQEPKPVKVVKIADDHKLCYCPGCDRPFCDFYYVKPKFCDKCGQAVKWE